MSFKAIDWAYTVRGLSPTERLILVFLAKSHNGKTNQCNPSTRTIATKLEIGRASVFRAFARFKTLGLITVARKYSKDGEQRPSQILLNLFVIPPQSHTETKKSHNDTPLESSSESEYESSEAPTTVVAIDLEFDKHSKVGKMPTVQELFENESKNKLTIESAIDKAKNGKNSYTSSRLAGLWRDLNVVCNTSVFQKEFTIKDMGQFSHIMKTEGMDAGKVMAACIQDWMGFGKYLKGQGIVFDFPDGPQIGFFLKHLALAVEFSKKATEPVSTIAMKPFIPA